MLPPDRSRAVVSGLLLLLQALRLRRQLSGQQEELLRALACQGDARLLRAYETVRSALHEAGCCNRMHLHACIVCASLCIEALDCSSRMA